MCISTDTIYAADGSAFILGITRPENNCFFNGGALFVVKVKADGFLETRWGTNGCFRYKYSLANNEDYPIAGYIQDDGTLIIGVYQQNFGVPVGSYIMKLDQLGQLDNTFGINLLTDGKKLVTVLKTSTNRLLAVKTATYDDYSLNF
jgi:hypothetical protein